MCALRTQAGVRQSALLTVHTMGRWPLLTVHAMGRLVVVCCAILKKDDLCSGTHQPASLNATHKYQAIAWY